MATLRLFGGLVLAALGVTAVAFTLEAYVGTHPGERSAVAPERSSRHTASAALLLMRPRARFVLLDPPQRVNPPGAAATSSAKPKSKPKETAASADGRHPPRPPEAPTWPWDQLR